MKDGISPFFEQVFYYVQFCRAFEAYIGSLEDMKKDNYSDKERGVEPQIAR